MEFINKITLDKTRDTLFYIYLNKFITIIFGLIMVPFYLERLGIGVYGYVALFSLFGIVVSNLDFGIFSSINKELSSSIKNAVSIKIPNLIGLLEGVIFVILIFLTITFSILHYSLDYFRTELSVIVFIITTWGCVKILDNLYRQTLFGLQLQKFHSQLNILLTFIKCISIYVLLKYIDSNFIYYLVGMFIPLGIGVVFFRKKIRDRLIYFMNLKVDNVNEKLIQVSKKFFLINVLGQVLLQMDKIIVYLFSLDMDSFGFYALGLTVAGLVLTATAPVYQFLFSKLPSIHNSYDTEGSFKYFNKFFKIIFLALFLIVTFFPIVGPKLLHLWLGDFAADFKLFLQVYIIFFAYVILSLLNLNVLYLQVTVSPTKAVKIIIFSIIVYAALSFVSYGLGYYNPLIILVSSYFLGYLYSKYILIKKLRAFDLKDDFINWEILMFILSIISLGNILFNKHLFEISLKTILNSWYLYASVIFIFTLIITLVIQKKISLFK